LKASDVTEDIAIAASAAAGGGAVSQVPHWPEISALAGLVAVVCFALTHALQGQGH
jgi:hypothetical protein